MDNLNDIIYRIILNNSKNKMITFDFKFGSREFCYCFNNKIPENDFNKILLHIKKNYNSKDIRYYKYRNYFSNDNILSVNENGDQKFTKKIPIEVNKLDNEINSLYVTVSKKLTLPSHLFNCSKNYNNIHDEEVISVNIRKLFKINLSVTNLKSEKIYSIVIQFIYNKNKHSEKIKQISEAISNNIKMIMNIINKEEKTEYKNQIIKL